MCVRCVCEGLCSWCVCACVCLRRDEVSSDFFDSRETQSVRLYGMKPREWEVTKCFTTDKREAAVQSEVPFRFLCVGILRFELLHLNCCIAGCRMEPRLRDHDQSLLQFSWFCWIISLFVFWELFLHFHELCLLMDHFSRTFNDSRKYSPTLCDLCSLAALSHKCPRYFLHILPKHINLATCYNKH